MDAPAILRVLEDAQLAHEARLDAEYREILDNTRLAIDPVNPALPGWLVTSLTPDWYIE